MALRKCVKCKEEKSLVNFIGVRSQLLNGTMPLCRACIAKEVGGKSEAERWNAVNKLCQLADIPFCPEEFEKCYKAHGTDAFGNYCCMFREKRYETLDWTVYNDAYLKLQEEKRVEDGLPELKAARLDKMRKRWGYEYDDQQLTYLENLYSGITASAGIVGALNDDQVLKLCKVSLIIEEKIRGGAEFDKDLKSYENLCKMAGITTQAIKDGSEFNSTGEVFAYLEKIGFKVNYYESATHDEVDKSMKDLQYWLRYMYINETGIAEEIKERIQGLQTADKIANSNFDWGEYEAYAADIDIENEDFEIDI